HDLALHHPVPELLLVVVALAVAVVDAAHRRVTPVDDADARGRVDVRARPDEDVPAPPRSPLGCVPRRPARAALRLALLEAHVPEIRAAAIDGARQAPPPLGPEGPEVVHLLEEGRQVLRLGDRDLVPELEEPLLVESP